MSSSDDLTLSSPRKGLPSPDRSTSPTPTPMASKSENSILENSGIEELEDFADCITDTIDELEDSDPVTGTMICEETTINRFDASADVNIAAENEVQEISDSLSRTLNLDMNDGTEDTLQSITAITSKENDHEQVDDALIKSLTNEPDIETTPSKKDKANETHSGMSSPVIGLDSSDTSEKDEDSASESENVSENKVEKGNGENVPTKDDVSAPTKHEPRPKSKKSSKRKTSLKTKGKAKRNIRKDRGERRKQPRQQRRRSGPRDVCPFYLKGSCHFGPQCHNYHSGPKYYEARYRKNNPEPSRQFRAMERVKYGSNLRNNYPMPFDRQHSRFNREGEFAFTIH